MKIQHRLLTAAILAGSLLCGCAAGTDSSDAAAVTHACTAKMMGMKTTITLTAPSEKSEVSSIQLEIVMPASYFGLDSFDTSTEEMEQTKQKIVKELAKELDLSESDLQAEADTDQLKIIIHLNRENQQEVLGLDSKASLVMSDMVQSLETRLDAVCD